MAFVQMAETLVRNTYQTPTCSHTVANVFYISATTVRIAAAGTQNRYPNSGKIYKCAYVTKGHERLEYIMRSDHVVPAWSAIFYLFMSFSRLNNVCMTLLANSSDLDAIYIFAQPRVYYYTATDM